MQRFFISIGIGIVAGLLAGLFIGWNLAPTEYINSPMPALAERYQQEYTVMIAEGYLLDADALGAVERLRVLGVSNVPLYVQEVTETFISNSRDLEDIRKLVALAAGLGRLTPVMEPYYQLQPAAGTNS
ncbi:hypothetical protein G4Y79_02200 [Phototrophicus methaneseepsis]|uniref:Uncharacterized protein n=1 Tax=Phototrophicus methaneseepsis TaxID=2710758 RepID=A0A7S8EAD4_9CHLR|nr:hypothetical protein [Phototrophicus methaneseepsis]QPC83209.1 hypothetical protein G4Y79_02200 [Phototrophicus methaneseepsis]